MRRGDRPGEGAVDDVAGRLRAANLLYREPTFCDEIMRDADPVDAVVEQVDRFAPDAASVLDIGCGTGRALRRLCQSPRFTGVGVDVQRNLLAHAGHHPRCRWVSADARTVRLGRTFDLVLCLGNTAAYMDSAADLAALLATFAAHAHPGTVLLMTTILGEPRTGGSSSTRETCLGPVTTRAVSSWDPETRVLSTARRWEFAGGRVEQDSIRRRCPTPHEMTTGLEEAGFRILRVGGSADPLSVVARYRHRPGPPHD